FYLRCRSSSTENFYIDLPSSLFSLTVTVYFILYSHKENFPLGDDFQLHCNKSYHLKWTMTTNRYSRVPWCCPLNSIFNHSLNRWMIVGRVCFMSWSEVKDFTSSSFKRRATSKHFPYLKPTYTN